MKKILFALAVVTTLLSSCCSQDYKIVGYLPSGRNGEINLDNYWWDVTHLNLCFVSVNADGTINDGRVRQCYEQVKGIAKERDFKLLASVAGGKFGEAVVNPTSRKALAVNLANLAKELPLDGIDLDYESWGFQSDTLALIPNALEDLVIELRAQLGRKKLITAAICTYGFYTKTMFDNMDFVSVMCYDRRGPWSKEGGPHSPFEYFLQGIKFCQLVGAPIKKIIPGVPFYGYGFPDGKTEHSYTKTYGDMVAEVPGSENMDCVNNEFYFDGMPTMTRKCQYVKDHKLGGIMFWQLGGDSRDPEKSLVKLIYRELKENK